jgi:hypothetical protein
MMARKCSLVITMLLTLGQQLKINDLINLFEPTKQGTLDFKRENATLHLSNHET